MDTDAATQPVELSTVAGRATDTVAATAAATPARAEYDEVVRKLAAWFTIGSTPAA